MAHRFLVSAMLWHGAAAVRLRTSVDTAHWPGGALRYRGEMAGGMPHGQGISYWKDGVTKVYEGEWLADKREGHGKQHFASGALYEGRYKAGKREGHGRMAYADGAVYEGQFKAGKKDGRGKLVAASGDVYEGDWRANKKQGHDTERRANGDEYSGEFREGSSSRTVLNMWRKSQSIGSISPLGPPEHR